MKIVHYIPLITLASVCLLRAQTNGTGSANATTNANTNTVSQILALVTTNPPAAKPQPQEIVIQSAGPAVFEQVEHGLRVVYRDQVRVDSPSFKLRCEWLRADLSQTGHPTNIVAETNVLIDATLNQGPVRATGEKAVYVYTVQNEVTNETVTLTGDAVADYKGVTNEADLIELDLIKLTMTIPANPKTFISGNFTGRLPGTNSPMVETNAPTMEANRPPTTPDRTNTLK